MAYMGFDKLAGSLKGKVRDPGAVAASIGRKKYGPAAFNKAAATGTKMAGMSHLPKGVKLTPVGDIGAHRGKEAKELGTFKNTPVLEPSEHWASNEPRLKTDTPYSRFKGTELGADMGD